MTTTETWRLYIEKTSGRPIRPLLAEALGLAGRPGRAIELGSGAGNEVAHLLRAGWEVLAVDREEVALEAARHLAAEAGAADALETLCCDLADLSLPSESADIIHASFSLFFTSPPAFPALWVQIRGALSEGGLFAGQLLGVRDEWATGPDPLVAHTRPQVDALLRGWQVLRCDEVDDVRPMAIGGEKRWHPMGCLVPSWEEKTPTMKELRGWMAPLVVGNQKVAPMIAGNVKRRFSLSSQIRKLTRPLRRRKKKPESISETEPDAGSKT